jgi:hypothetical protein
LNKPLKIFVDLHFVYIVMYFLNKGQILKRKLSCHLKQREFGQMWWCMPVVLGGRGRKGGEFKDNLS